MERFTISLDDQLFAQFDKVVHARGYVNRSEAIRDLIREYLETARLQKNNKGYCIATLSYIYNHLIGKTSDILNRASKDYHFKAVIMIHMYMHA